MGIYGAINAAVSGLTAQSTALENISGNVANSQTTGYKRLDTTFADLVSGGGSIQASQVSGTTYATSRATNTLQGDIASSDVDTYIAINGEGYFVVTEAADIVDGQTTFADSTYYTRAGDFEVDREGYFVNSSGYYLQGFELDETTGNPVGSEPTVVQISSEPLAAQPSSAITYQANLPPVPETSDYDPNTANSDLLNTSGTIAADEHILSGDETDFLNSSIIGGSTTIYDENGSSINVEMRWAKTAANTWNLYYASDGDATDAYKLIGEVTFDASGDVQALAVPTDAAADGNTVNGTTSFTVASIAVNGVDAANIEINFGTSSLTQQATNSSTTNSLSISQNGYAAGELEGISVDSAGRVIASYSNSQTRAVYELPIATFEAEQNLRRVDGAAFAATSTSGEPDLSGGGTIIANAMELSNADIADEFAKLIITQQAYSANSRIVTSADEMLDDALNMVR